MKHLMWLYTLLFLVGCTEEASLFDSSSKANEEIYAVIESENADSRTYIDDQIRMRWTAEDCISLFRKTTYNREYMFTGKTGANAGGFKQVSTDDEFWYGADVPYNYAIYPHSSDTKMDESGYFEFTMPAKQTYAENSFGVGANTMVAVSESGQLTFKNIGSYLRVRLYGENTAISSITLTTKGEEAISGTAKITPTLNGNPTCEMIGSGKSIQLVCPTPVTISSDANAPTDFWIVVPFITLANGFTVTVENSAGNTQVYDVAKSFTFARNSYYNLVREVNIASDIPYVTFTAEDSQTLTMSKAVATLEYSVNDGEWKELGTTTVPFGGDNGNLRLRGKNRYGTASGRLGYTNFTYSSINFGNVTPVACTGDIRTLLDYENYLTVHTGNAMFSYLFYYCTCLTSAPKLPATDLKASCYLSMFYECRSLTEAPQLPATTLEESCYKNMFYECSSLTEVPELPATTLAKSCYYDMFHGCSSLTYTPELPAKTLAELCYSFMFSGCSSLTNAPELPATTLAESCYQNMFSVCSSLTEAPQLPATTLAPNCYSFMFSGCSSLTNAPELPVTTLTKSCYKSMFAGCSSLTNVPKLVSTTLAESCYQNMFSGCSSLTEAPQLPATTLAKSCYSGMFAGCSSLTNAPELPATTLAELCYERMFYGCSSLTEAPQLPVTTLARSCYGSMFYGCSSLTEAPELPAKTLAKSCYGSMFYGCNSLTNAPELPATTLAESCYGSMFYGCSSLTNAPELPATTLAGSCYENMFYGCSSLTEAPELPATTLAFRCYYYMFFGCSKLNKITMLATDISASGCLTNWLRSVSKTGTFTKSASMNDLPTGYNGIPTAWTVVDYTE